VRHHDPGGPGSASGRNTGISQKDPERGYPHSGSFFVLFDFFTLRFIYIMYVFYFAFCLLILNISLQRFICHFKRFFMFND
jgi:hypothetical protein